MYDFSSKGDVAGGTVNPVLSLETEFPHRPLTMSRRKERPSEASAAPNKDQNLPKDQVSDMRVGVGFRERIEQCSYKDVGCVLVLLGNLLFPCKSLHVTKPKDRT